MRYHVVVQHPSCVRETLLFMLNSLYKAHKEYYNYTHCTIIDENNTVIAENPGEDIPGSKDYNLLSCIKIASMEAYLALQDTPYPPNFNYSSIRQEIEYEYQELDNWTCLSFEDVQKHRSYE